VEAEAREMRGEEVRVGGSRLDWPDWWKYAILYSFAVAYQPRWPSVRDWVRDSHPGPGDKLNPQSGQVQGNMIGGKSIENAAPRRTRQNVEQG
jgi:hypothetical protein